MKFWEGTVRPVLSTRIPLFSRRERPDRELARSFPHVRMGFSLFIDGKRSDTATVDISDEYGRSHSLSFDFFARQLNFLASYYNSWPFLNSQLEGLKNQLRERYPGSDIRISKELFLRGDRISSYTVKNDNYFMMGDNRDNSADSRYWGYVNRNFVKAKAFILYFSLDSDTPWSEPWSKIRWSRIGKLIRSWNGLHPPTYYR